MQQKIGLSPIIDVIKSRLLKLFGHIKRSKLGMSKICLEGKVQGKRSKGHPRMRWMDNVHDWSGLTIAKLNIATQNRDLWRGLTHVGAHSAKSGESE